MIFPGKATSLVLPASLEDIPALAEIHARSFARAWSGAEIEGLLQDKLVECFVLRRTTYRITDKVVGFVLVRTVVDEAEILTIAVDPDTRKTGAGYEIMADLMRRLYGNRVAKLFLEVDASNLPALSLYRKLGFEQVGERKGYYTSGKEEPSRALIMQSDLTN